MYEKTVEPYLVDINFPKSLKADSLKPEQRQYVNLSCKSLSQVLLSLGSYHERAANALYSAPVPEKIMKLPVQYYLYKQKMTETVTPLIDQAFNKYLAIQKLAREKGLGDSLQIAFNDSLARLLYRRGFEYDTLALEVLNKPVLPKEMKAVEREEVMFQLEDVGFELQDRAIKAYEEGYNYLKDNAVRNPWSIKIIEALKRLDPQTYTPKEVLQRISVGTGPDWMERPDSIAFWYRTEVLDTFWRPAPVKPQPVPEGDKRLEGYQALGSAGGGKVYLKHLFYLNGKPTKATASIRSRGKYRLFLNGVLIFTDSTAGRAASRTDTFDVKSYLNGGDNSIAISAEFLETSAGVLFALASVIDTSLHYETRFGLKPAVDLAPAAPAAAPAAVATPSPAAAAKTPVPAQVSAVPTAKSTAPAVVPAAAPSAKASVAPAVTPAAAVTAPVPAAVAMAPVPAQTSTAAPAAKVATPTATPAAAPPTTAAASAPVSGTSAAAASPAPAVSSAPAPAAAVPAKTAPATAATPASPVSQPPAAKSAPSQTASATTTKPPYPAPAPKPATQTPAAKPAAAPAPKATTAASAPAPAKKDYTEEFRNRLELQKAITDAQVHETEMNKDVKSTQTRIRALKYRIDSMNDELKAVESDTRIYKKMLEEKSRSR